MNPWLPLAVGWALLAGTLDALVGPLVRKRDEKAQQRREEEVKQLKQWLNAQEDV